jgi:hypothetical protein
VFTGTRGRQLAGRCGVINTSTFPYAGEWKSLVAAMEGTLRPHNHTAGTLVADAKYLHQRTGGMIGSLAHLIRSAAIRSMLDETESVTRELMDTVAHRLRRPNIIATQCQLRRQRCRCRHGRRDQQQHYREPWPRFTAKQLRPT